MKDMQKEDAAVTDNQVGVDRRSFVKGAGFAGLGLAGATLLAGRVGLMETSAYAQSAPSAISDTDILNFALNLEYLEAEFYTVATTGRTIKESGIGVDGVGRPGPTTGGQRVHLERNDGDRDADDEKTGMLRKVAEEVTYDEQQHVMLLRGALGSAAIAKPAIDLDALGIGFRNFRQFLQLARAFEDVGVSAYGGAAPLLTSKQILATAARIALTEALHSGNFRLLVAENNVQTTPVDSLDILPPPSGTQYFEVNQQALAIVRTTGQVLAIVYGNSAPGTQSGGFFPFGVNGTINTV